MDSGHSHPAVSWRFVCNSQKGFNRSCIVQSVEITHSFEGRAA
jgi:hypothetical protein